MRKLRTLVCLFLAFSMLLSFLTVYAKTPDELPQSPLQAEPANDTTKTYSNGLDENGFWIGLRALDYVERFNHKALVIPSKAHWISDEFLQTNIEGMLGSYISTVYNTDRAVVYGDTINIDFVGSIDGVEFDGGSTGGMGTNVTIGITEYIDDFLLQLIGHMPGETVDVKVRFPDDYIADLAGKDALFVTVINYIEESGVDLTLTDDFVQQNLYYEYGWSTVAEFKAGLRSELQKQSIENYIMEYLTTAVAIRSIPELLIEHQITAMMNYYQDYADYYGMELLELLYNEGLYSVDELIESYRDFNMTNATYYLVIQAVAEDAGISVSAKDVADYCLKNYGSSDYSMLEEQYGLPYITHFVLCQKVVDYIAQNAVLAVCVVLNGRRLDFDVSPQIINGRTLVPLRAIFEELGAKVDWDGSAQKVTATKDDTEVVLIIGSKSPTVNGKVISIDQPGIIINGRTLVPLRFISETLGASVKWDGGTKTVTITS